MQERIQKLMSQAGCGSRRHNEQLIASGRVRLNGRLAQLGDKADAATDTLEVDGRPLTFTTEKYIYIALNKPRGIISSLEDELNEGRKTVRDLINLPGHLYPVGRLDKQSEGLILMTNDGELANRITHPRYGHRKVYEVTLIGSLSLTALTQWRRGILLDDKQTAPANVEILSDEDGLTILRVTMREGKKRQIRRIATLLGYEVRRLVRLQIGPIRLGSLASGQWRHLTPEEVRALQTAVGFGK